MKYNKILEGRFLKRPNRFIAHVLIDGREEIAHVKNTGRCKELLVPGARVLLEDWTNSRKRKTKYSIISVWKNNILINMDSQVPNKVVYEALNDNKISEFKNLLKVNTEVTYGNSRFDIYFEGEKGRGFIEVKGVTLEVNGSSMFPDAPTKRGSKHVFEMVNAVKDGYIGVLFFLIQMRGPKTFKLNWKMDREFSQAVEYASKNNVKILAYDSIVSYNSIIIGEPLKIDLNPSK